MVRIYWSLWILFAVATVLMLASGSFTMMAAVVFGFAAFGLTFAGMICVLPSIVSHLAEAKPISTKPDSQPSPAAMPARAFGTLKSA